MDEEEEGRRSAVRSGATPRNLTGMSIEDLEAYVRFLEVERERTLREIEERRNVKGAAEALFRKPTGG